MNQRRCCHNECKDRPRNVERSTDGKWSTEPNASRSPSSDIWSWRSWRALDAIAQFCGRLPGERHGLRTRTIRPWHRWISGKNRSNKRDLADQLSKQFKRDQTRCGTNRVPSRMLANTRTNGLVQTARVVLSLTGVHVMRKTLLPSFCSRNATTNTIRRSWQSWCF